jgi:hypothetical protein
VYTYFSRLHTVSVYQSIPTDLYLNPISVSVSGSLSILERYLFLFPEQIFTLSTGFSWASPAVTSWRFSTVDAPRYVCTVCTWLQIRTGRLYRTLLDGSLWGLCSPYLTTVCEEDSATIYLTVPCIQRIL